MEKKEKESQEQQSQPAHHDDGEEDFDKLLDDCSQ